MSDTIERSTDAAYLREIERFRADRDAYLTAEDGWLTVVGLEWLETGPNRVGSAEDNDIVLPRGPGHLGTITVSEAGEVGIAFAAEGLATVDGRAVMQTRLVDTAERPNQPEVVRFGPVNFHVADRDGRKGLRIKDNENPARTRFTGLDTFPADPAWRIVAEWVKLDPPVILEVANTWGNIRKRATDRKAVFAAQGRTWALLPVPSTISDLVFVLADRTSGKETYGACRFLTGELIGDDKIVLDFNKAVNPPCAFTVFATCPIAPPENRLTLRITAGEKTYKAPV